MRTILDAADRAALLARAERVATDARPLWGRMDAPGMLRHVSEAAAMALGDVQLDPLGPAWLGRLVRGPVIGWLPWPRGVPTAPELILRSGADPATARAELAERLERLAARGPGGPFGVHPLFGRLSGRQWGRLMWRHVDHHLRQFGV